MNGEAQLQKKAVLDQLVQTSSSLPSESSHQEVLHLLESPVVRAPGDHTRAFEQLEMQLNGWMWTEDN